MEDLEATKEGTDHLRTISVIELFNRVVRGNNEVAVHEGDSTALIFTNNRVLISPELEIMA